MSDEPASPGLWAAIRREPLVWFAVLGGALGVAWVLLAPAPAETVRVESETLRSLEKQREDLLGRPVTDEERQQARDSFVDEEVLLREALRRGLQWSDGRVRQRLTRIMRASMSETVPDPSVAQLQAYFQENIEQVHDTGVGDPGAGCVPLGRGRHRYGARTGAGEAAIGRLAGGLRSFAGGRGPAYAAAEPGRPGARPRARFRRPGEGAPGRRVAGAGGIDPGRPPGSSRRTPSAGGRHLRASSGRPPAMPWLGPGS